MDGRTEPWPREPERLADEWESIRRDEDRTEALEGQPLPPPWTDAELDAWHERWSRLRWGILPHEGA